MAKELYDECRMGNMTAVMKLLAFRQFQDLKYVSDGSKQYFPLHVATDNGHDKLVDMLCKCGADANQRDDKGNTPLHLATFKGHYQVIRTLVKLGADVDAAGVSGNTPLHIATLISVVLRLYLPDVSTDGTYPVLSLLLELGAKLKTNGAGQNPLDTAFNHNDERLMIKLLESRSFGDVEGNVEILQLVLYHVDPTVAVRLALRLLGSIQSQPQRFTLLVQVLMDAHSTGQSMVILLNKIDQLFEAPDSQIPLPEGIHALLNAAVALENEDVVKMLIDQGASVNATNPDIFPLRTACAGNSLGIVQLLVQRGARVNQRVRGWAPLHFAAFGKRIDYAVMLLQNGADVDLQSKNSGGTPLHIAYSVGCLDLVNILRLNNADSTMLDNYAKIPSEYANFN